MALFIWLGGVFWVLIAFAIVSTGFSGATEGLAIGLAIGSLLIWIGSGIRNFQRWAHIPVTILSVLGLRILPVGTLINAHILYVIFSEKRQTVFGPENRAIVDVTRQI